MLDAYPQVIWTSGPHVPLSVGFSMGFRVNVSINLILLTNIGGLFIQRVKL